MYELDSQIMKIDGESTYQKRNNRMQVIDSSFKTIKNPANTTRQRQFQPAEDNSDIDG